MTEAELLSVAHDTVTRMDTIFEFWITATFAVLVTFFFIGERATKVSQWISAVLYSVFSALMINRFSSVGFIFEDLRVELLEMGSVGVISNTTTVINFVLWPSIFVLGTISTLFFIFSRSRILKLKEPINKR